HQDLLRDSGQRCRPGGACAPRCFRARRRGGPARAAHGGGVPMNSSPRVAVVGATGLVGQTMLAVLREREFPAAEIVPFASARSAGNELDGMRVRGLDDESIQGFDVALFSAGASVSREWGPRFVDDGAVVVDNSS